MTETDPSVLILVMTQGHRLRGHHLRRRNMATEDFVFPDEEEMDFFVHDLCQDRVGDELTRLGISFEDFYTALSQTKPVHPPPKKQRSSTDHQLCYKCDHLFGVQFTHSNRTIKVVLSQQASEPSRFRIIMVFDTTETHTPYNNFVLNWETRWANLTYNRVRYEQHFRKGNHDAALPPLWRAAD